MKKRGSGVVPGDVVVLLSSILWLSFLAAATSAISSSATLRLNSAFIFRRYSLSPPCATRVLSISITRTFRPRGGGGGRGEAAIAVGGGNRYTAGGSGCGCPPAMATSTNQEGDPTKTGTSSPKIHEPPSLLPRAQDYAIMTAKLLTFDKGWIFQSSSPGQPDRVVVKRNIRDVDRDKIRTIFQQLQFTEDSRWVEGSTVPLELTGASAITLSPSGQYTLLFKEESRGGDQAEKKIYAEVWSPTSLIKTIPLDQSHGPLRADNYFGSFTWSTDEQTIAYVAENKAVKRESAFRAGNAAAAAATASSSNPPTNETPVNKYEYVEDWGEKYEGLAETGLYLLSIRTGRIARVPGVDENVTPGQPLLTADNHLLYVAWPDLPRRLGLIYCYQRPSSIWATNVEELICAMNQVELSDNFKAASSAHSCLTPGERLARSPVLSRDGNKLAYLGSVEGFDTHNGPISLRVLDWAAFIRGGNPVDLSCITVVDTVSNPSPDAGGFPGLWLDNLHPQCWSLDDQCLFLTTAWGSINRLLRITLNGGITVIDQATLAAAADGVISAGGGAGGGGTSSSDFSTIRDASVSLLTVSHQGLLVAASSPNSPGGFGIISFSDGRFIPAPQVHSASISSSQYPIERYRDISLKLKGVRWKILSIQPRDPNSSPFEAILMLPPRDNASKLPPLVVVPHGGPHAVTPTAFSHAYAFLCVSFGFAILHINFRGSTGFGGAPLQSLAGKIGSQDVNDIYVATMLVAEMEPHVVNKGKIGIVGGSHGGFLAGHMIGQYPDVFKVAALRNPVCNIAGMVSATDIPDWCYIETFGPGSYDFSRFFPPTAEQLAAMWASSPIAWVDRVRAPTLIALGKKDRRVPYSQGLEYYHALRSRGVETRLLVYHDDIHAIDRPASEADHWLQIGEFLAQYLAVD